MRAENTKLESRSYGLYITFFVFLIFISQLFFGFYTYCVIKPKIMHSVDVSLEQFKENLIKTIERNKNDIFYYTLFDRKKRDVLVDETTPFVEGSGSSYDYDYDSEEDYEVKDVEKYCKRIKDNCVHAGPAGIPGLPGPKGIKGERGIPGLPGLPTTNAPTMAPTTTSPSDITTVTATSEVVNVTESITETSGTESTTGKTTTSETTTIPNGSVIITYSSISLCVLSIFLVLIN